MARPYRAAAVAIAFRTSRSDFESLACGTLASDYAY